MRKILFIAAALLAGSGVTACQDRAAPANTSTQAVSSAIPVDATLQIVDLWHRLDYARQNVDQMLVASPKLAGTVAAQNLALHLEGAKTWLKAASEAQNVEDARGYFLALGQAKAALDAADAQILAIGKGTAK